MSANASIYAKRQLLLTAAVVALHVTAAEAQTPPAEGQVAVCFTPAEACDSEIIAAIDAARATIRVQAYQFTAAPILASLAHAARRGVDVRVILDRINDRTGMAASYSGATFVAHAGIPVWSDYRPTIAHNKAIIIDRQLVVGGSYNYTRSAEMKNAENVLFIRSTEIAARFEANWESRQSVSRAYEAAE